MAAFRVLLDSCVLIPACLRDTLLRAAAHGFYQVYWSEEILNEVHRNLIGRGLVKSDTSARRAISTMTSAFPEALVCGYEALTPVMPNDPKDQHVMAAAVLAHAQVVVTSNLHHFPRKKLETFGLEPQSPDTFLSHLFDLAPEQAVRLVHDQAADLKDPPMDLNEVLSHLEKCDCVTFARSVRSYRQKNLSIPRLVKPSPGKKLDASPINSGSLDERGVSQPKG